MKNFKKTVLCLLIMGLITTSAWGAGEKPFFGYVMHNFGSQFTVIIKDGAEDAGKDLGVDVEVTGPAAMDPPTAISMFENLLNKNPSGMAVVPNPQDPWKPILNQYAEEAKIIMVANGDAPGTPRQAYYGVDEVEFGRAEARAVLQAGVTSGKVVVGSCYPPALPLQQRFEGIQEVLADYSDIDLVGPIDITAEQTTNSRPGKTSLRPIRISRPALDFAPSRDRASHA